MVLLLGSPGTAAELCEAKHDPGLASAPRKGFVGVSAPPASGSRSKENGTMYIFPSPVCNFGSTMSFLLWRHSETAHMTGMALWMAVFFLGKMD